MKGTRANEKLYWASRARSYPLPFDPGTAARTRRTLRLLRELGADLAGKEVLDIGCGTGVYALQLAASAPGVTGVDSSAPMLRVFREQRRARGIRNARCLLSEWGRLPASRVRGRYGAALASMTAAVKTRADVLKMEAAAPLRVYIGWAGVRRNALLEKVYAAHGLRYAAPEGAERVLRILRALGRRPRVVYLEDGWQKTGTVAQVLREIAVSMKVNGTRFRRDWTLALLRASARGGLVRQRTRARKAVIVWGGRAQATAAASALSSSGVPSATSTSPFFSFSSGGGFSS